MSTARSNKIALMESGDWLWVPDPGLEEKKTSNNHRCMRVCMCAWAYVNSSCGKFQEGKVGDVMRLLRSRERLL